MLKLSSKTIITANEWNQIPREIQYIITSSGITLTSDLDQLAIALANYAARATFYVGSGTANSQQLTTLSGFPLITSYNLGMLVHWRPSVANTGTTTIFVDSAGGVNLRKESTGGVLTGGELVTTKDAKARHDGSVFLLLGV